VQPRPPALVPMNVPPPPPLFIKPVEQPRPPPPAPPVVAAPPPPRPTVITQPDWSQKPSADDMARYYPERAQRLNVTGRAELACTVLANGKVNCDVASEDPPDQGFGDAAMKLSKLFKMRPMSRDGVPTNGGRVNIPIRFQLPKD
jgi:protein TonB